MPARLVRIVMFFAALWGAGVAGATPLADAGGRVGRLADLQGPVSLYDTETGQWDEALRNRAVTEGDRLSTGPSGRAEVRIGSTELRLGGGAELEIQRLDDERMVLQLWRGSLAVRVRSREIASEVEVRTREARFQPDRAGHYRIDREDDTSAGTAWRGSLRVLTTDPTPFDVGAGRRVEVSLMRDGTPAIAWAGSVQDAFADAVARDEVRDERSASYRYVSPEMTGVEDLDRHGRWERHPEFGMVWSPLGVAAGWAPFRHGRWTWHVRWGWTWVDAAPWGFAPFHYGRWVLWGTRWVWTPGAWTPRPAFAPALVAWSTSPGVSVSISIGNRYTPPAHWSPLPPRQPYVPIMPHTHRYVERVNQPHHGGKPITSPQGPHAVVPDTAVPHSWPVRPAREPVSTGHATPVPQARPYVAPEAVVPAVPPKPTRTLPGPAFAVPPQDVTGFQREPRPDPRADLRKESGRGEPRSEVRNEGRVDSRGENRQRAREEPREEGGGRRGDSSSGKVRDQEHRPREARERQQLL